MNRRTRAAFTPDFRLEASQLVVDQNYKIQKAGVRTISTIATSRG